MTAEGERTGIGWESRQIMMGVLLLWKERRKKRLGKKNFGTAEKFLRKSWPGG